MFTQLVDDLSRHVDAERLMRTLGDIHNLDRWFTFPSFERSAEYAAEALLDAGLAKAEKLEFVADGKTAHADWVAPLAWDVGEARLEVVSPTVQEPVLADRQQDPCAVVMWCAPTPPEGVEGEVVPWDELADEERQTIDATGKFVFTEKSPAGIKAEAAERNAAGILSSYHGGDRAGPEGTFWQNNWSDHGMWAMTAADSRLTGFMLATEAAEKLRSLLRSHGVVRVRARAEARLYKGSVPVVTGVIPGEGPEEVLVLGHMFEQGACDNASGAAAIIQCANALSKSGRRFRRSIRFLLTSECYGTIPFALMHRKTLQRTVAALNLDMLSPWTGDDAPLELIENPHASVCFSDPLLRTIVEHVFAADQLPYAVQLAPFSVADNLLADPYLGAPTSMLTWATRTYWHNSADTPDRLDPRAIRALAVSAAAWLAFIADAGTPEVKWLGERLVEDAGHRLAAADADHRAYLADREAARVLSLARLTSGGSTMQQEVEAKARALHDDAPLQADAGRGGSSDAELVPVRRCLAPLTLHRASNEDRDRFPSPLWSGELNCALYWADGRRSIAEIARLVELERGECSVDFVGWFRLLEKHRHVRLQRSSR